MLGVSVALTQGDPMKLRKLTKHYTVDEYLRFEDRTTLRHEFHNGELYAMEAPHPMPPSQSA